MVLGGLVKFGEAAAVGGAGGCGGGEKGDTASFGAILRINNSFIRQKRPLEQTAISPNHDGRFKQV